MQIKFMSTANSYDKQNEFFINWISSAVSQSLRVWLPYSQKQCPKANTMLFNHFGPHLLEVLCEGVQDHHEAVDIVSGGHGDYIHLDQAPASKEAG
jgi:hypothetical protein